MNTTHATIHVVARIQPSEITDGITSSIEVRKQRGLGIAALAHIEK